jgi:hypothetical protein
VVGRGRDAFSSATSRLALSDGVEAAAVLRADVDGVIAAMNSAASKPTGYTARELLG